MMIRLKGSNKLQVVLSGAATASRVTVSWMDFTSTTTAGDVTLTATNGVTPVDICAAPAADTCRQIDYIGLVALAAMTPTFSIHNGSALTIFTAVLAIGDTVEYTHAGGWKVTDANGAIKTVASGVTLASGKTLQVNNSLILAGTDGKTLTVSNSITLAGTDGSTLNIGTGGTLGTAAYTSAGAYQPADADLTTWAGVTPGTGVATALAVNVGSAGAVVLNGGALGSPSSAETIPAHTLGGTISGGGNQINNVVIGASTPLAGSFTFVGVGVAAGGDRLALSGDAGSFATLPQTTLSINDTDVAAGGTTGGRLLRIFNRRNSGYVTQNASSIDGTNWTLDQTAAGGVQFLINNTAVTVLFASAGANPRTMVEVWRVDPNVTVFAPGITATFNNTTDATDSSTAAVMLTGGLAVAKGQYIGTFLNVGTTITGPTHIGGTGATSTLTLQSTSGTGTSGSDNVLIKTGTNGSVTSATFKQTGVDITSVLSIGNTVGAAVAIASTHKVTMVIGGTTYYLLASNV